MSTSRRDNRQEQELRAIIDDIPGNDKCADCEAHSPRWASYSLGVFLCTRCASIHRKNSDMSKVKSISLDTWTTEQIRKMREVGNTISNYNYNPLREWPLQDDDLTMERFIKDKYEKQRFMSQRETANFIPVKSAMKGSASPIEPGKSSSSVIKYSKELDTLREMGFTDRAKNVDVLKEVMGNVAVATEKLVSMESDNNQTPVKHTKPRVRFTADTIGGEEQTPQFQSANPFDMFKAGAQQGPGVSQQDFSNPFSSIPPSMYNNQNFVQNVHSGYGSQQFMGGQGIGQEQQYVPPAAPLRQQLTGGQPLRPQLQYPDAGQNQQTQPLGHQLTGRQPPPPASPSRSMQGSQSQSYQQTFPSNQQGGFSQFPPNEYRQQAELQPQSTSQISHSAFPSASLFPPNNDLRAASASPMPTLKPQLTGGNGLRPKFQPTVNLQGPFGNMSHNLSAQAESHDYNTPSPQLTGQNQSLSSQHQNLQALQSIPSNSNYNRFSPQATGNMHSQPVPQQNQFTGNYTQNTYRPLQAHLTGGQMPQIQQQGAPQQGLSQSQSSDPFGNNFVAPLRAQLTGIQQQSFGTQQMKQEPANNNFMSQQHSLQPSLTGSMGGMPNQFTGQQSQGNGNYMRQGQFPDHTMPSLFAQNTGPNQPQANRLYSQNTNGVSTSGQPNQFPQHGAFASQPSNSFTPFQQPQDSYRQDQKLYQQPQQNQYGPQFQQQMGGNHGINPSKPFDKASIMSLYGAQPAPNQPQQASQPYMNNGYQQGNMYGYR